MFLKNKNIIFKIRRSKVTDYAALRGIVLTFNVNFINLYAYTLLMMRICDLVGSLVSITPY